jgi:hypothetical protein
MESTWSPDGVYMKTIAQLSKYALFYVDSMWTLVEAVWSYGVHIESMGEDKVHL